MMNATSETARDRNTKRLVGFTLFTVGLIMCVTAVADFLYAMNASVTGEPPTKGWMLLVGLPMVAIGVWVLDGVWLRPPPSYEVLIQQVAYDDPDAEKLIDQVQAEYIKRYGGPDETPIEAAMFAPPAGAFFVAYLDDAPVAMGGWRLRPDVKALDGTSPAEIKRMFVTEELRRHGIARQLLAHLELTAKIAGADAMILETGTAQPEAINLYIREGYTSVAPFGYYAASTQARYFGKRLLPDVPGSATPAV